MLAVERIQKRMLRMVYEDYDSPYEDLLAKCHIICICLLKNVKDLEP